MKSSTIRRATLSRESMDVIENLAREQQADESGMGEYYRPDEFTESVEDSSNKSKEIDLLWQNFKTTQFNTNSPFVNLLVGFVVGVLTTLIVFACFGVFSKTPSVQNSNPALEQSLSEQVEETQEELNNNRVSVPGENDTVQPTEPVSQVSDSTPTVDTEKNSSEMTKYVVKNGDTGEAIIKRHYGSWSEEKMNAVIKANNLKNLDRLQIDQVLYLP